MLTSPAESIPPSSFMAGSGVSANGGAGSFSDDDDDDWLMREIGGHGPVKLWAQRKPAWKDPRGKRRR